MQEVSDPSLCPNAPPELSPGCARRLHLHVLSLLINSSKANLGNELKEKQMRGIYKVAFILFRGIPFCYEKLYANLSYHDLWIIL